MPQWTLFIYKECKVFWKERKGRGGRMKMKGGMEGREEGENQ